MSISRVYEYACADATLFIMLKATTLHQQNNTICPCACCRRQVFDLTQRATTAEKALSQQALGYEQQLEELRRWYAQQILVGSALRKKLDPTKDKDLIAFTNAVR